MSHRARRIGCWLIVMLAGSRALGAPLPVDKSQWQLPRWNTNVQVVPDGENGLPCFKLTTIARDWAQQIRRPVFYPSEVARVVFTGRMKTQDVTGGAAAIEKARAQLAFLDQDGERVGNWPATTDRAGTTDWADFHQELTCPPNTRVVEVWLGMYLSTGTAWFDQVDLTAYDAAGKELTPQAAPPGASTDTTGWVKFDPGTDDTTRLLVIDYAPYIPAPAGQFGFVGSKDGHLTFENGQRARFWGSGIVMNWNPEKAEAEKYADRLVRAGVNIVRLHGMDAVNPSASIFDVTSPKTDRLDPAKLDRLDYMVFCLKQRGVYIDLNLLTKRHYLPGDDVPDSDKLPQGGKAVSMFNRRLIQLQKDYDHLILDHVNPYTHLAYKDEPSIAMLEIVNESTVGSLEFGGGLTPVYEQELNGLFAKWCESTRTPMPTDSIRMLIKSKHPIAMQFVEFIGDQYFSEMHTFLKNEMGVKVPIAGTQYDFTVGEKRVQAKLDLLDHHDYWDHPSGGWDPMSIFTNKPMVKLTGSKQNVIEHLVGNRVKGKPYMVSEWNFAWPNDYMTEGPLLVASYAGYDDWDAAMIFGIDGLRWAPRLADTFNHENKPHLMAPLMTAALSFYRGDVTPGAEKAVDVSKLPAGTPVADLFTRQELLTERCVASSDGSPAARDTAAGKFDPAATQPSDYRTADGQIDWRADGQFVLDTPRTQAVLGFTGGKAITTRDLSVTMHNPFAQVIATSLTSDPIATTSRLLLCATARAENTNEKFRPFRHGLSDLGTGPILLEPVKATIILRRAGSKAPTVHLIDWFGRRMNETVPVNAAGEGAWTFNLGDRPVGWFEVAFEK